MLRYETTRFDNLLQIVVDIWNMEYGPAEATCRSM